MLLKLLDECVTIEYALKNYGGKKTMMIKIEEKEGSILTFTIPSYSDTILMAEMLSVNLVAKLREVFNKSNT